MKHMECTSNMAAIQGVTNDENKEFMCGCVEGFYGRPWSNGQRKELFRRMKRLGMGVYMYAPKDDCKHRGFWRDLYSVEEAEHLSNLIESAKEHDVDFVYAISPGLDVTYSSNRDITCLKKKLDQVYGFGCVSFAILFDDIEVEMCEADKGVFQSFAHAQVSVTNEIYQHLGIANVAKFLFCPTEYCSTRAIPTVATSEYLTTIGSKLLPGIDILWTGPKVVSKFITSEHIEELSSVLKRPPLIWDNLHANDYDQKRLFLGPYDGRSTAIIPLIRGVLTNPNCEFESNYIALDSLVQWSKCTSDDTTSNTDDAKLEQHESGGSAGGCGRCDDVCTGGSPGAHPTPTPPASPNPRVYSKRLALRKAIINWMTEIYFNVPLPDSISISPPVCLPGPGPAPTGIPEPLIPLLPIPVEGVNTCQSVLTQTTSSLCEAGATATNTASTITSPQEPVTVTTTSITQTITSSSTNSSTSAAAVGAPHPMDTGGISTNPHLQAHTVGAEPVIDPDLPVAAFQEGLETAVAYVATAHDVLPMLDDPERKQTEICGLPVTTQVVNSLEFTENDPYEQMETGSSTSDSAAAQGNHGDGGSGSSGKGKEDSQAMSVQTAASGDDDGPEAERMQTDNNDLEPLTVDDVELLVDLFYLPYEHGAKGVELLTEFYWLKTNGSVLRCSKRGADDESSAEWRRRAAEFNDMHKAISRMFNRLSHIPNRFLFYELYPYVLDMKHAVGCLNAFVKWMGVTPVYGYMEDGLQKQDTNLLWACPPQLTWSTKGYKEAFMSGDQEAWVFRGGLTAEFQRMLPIDGAHDLFAYPPPLECPPRSVYTIRPYLPEDERSVYDVCRRTCDDGLDGSSVFPDHKDLIGDKLVGGFLTLSPEHCFVVENEIVEVIAYALAALDAKQYYAKYKMAWIEEMCNKYPKPSSEDENMSPAEEIIASFHNFKSNLTDHVYAQFPSLIKTSVLLSVNDYSVPKRLMACLLSTLKANGSCGAHCEVNVGDKQMLDYYKRLGFVEIPVIESCSEDIIVLGRRI